MRTALLAATVVLGCAWYQCAALPLCAAGEPAEAGNRASAEPDSVLRQQSGWLFLLPVIAYTPETELMFGLTAGRYHRFDRHPDSRPSTFTPAVVYTAKKQTIIYLPADLYWQRDIYHATGVLSYLNFPDKFYGIGNDTPDSLEEDYTPRTLTFNTTLLKMILTDLYCGAQYDFATSKMVKKEEGGLLDSGLIPGSDGGIVSGLGLLTDYDSRDDIYFPAAGSFVRAAAIFYDNALGSDFDFSRYDLDVRTYFSFAGRNVLALQAWGQSTTGVPPFQMMPRLTLRGYFEGRFRDKNMLIFQGEYRRMVWRRLGVVLFGGFGQVARKIGDMAMDEFKPAYGTGIRFQMGGEERINLRLDFGWGENSSGMYLMFGEAF